VGREEDKQRQVVGLGDSWWFLETRKAGSTDGVPDIIGVRHILHSILFEWSLAYREKLKDKPYYHATQDNMRVGVYIVYLHCLMRQVAQSVFHRSKSNIQKFGT
jgi:hypothetical protein